MEQSPSWEANSHSANNEISRLSFNQKVHYCVHNSPPVAPILSQMNPVHTFPRYFLKIHFNIILPTTSMPSAWSLPFRFLNQRIIKIYLSHSCYMARPSHPPWFDHPNHICWRLKVTKLDVSLFPIHNKGGMQNMSSSWAWRNVGVILALKRSKLVAWQLAVQIPNAKFI